MNKIVVHLTNQYESLLLLHVFTIYFNVAQHIYTCQTIQKQLRNKH